MELFNGENSPRIGGKPADSFFFMAIGEDPLGVGVKQEFGVQIGAHGSW